jgi:FemAB-related protein (PEP-CTERM system-associated)
VNAPVRFSHEVTAFDPHDARSVRALAGFVAEQGASLFHLPEWLIAAQEGTGQRAGGLIARQLGVVTGWLPLTEVRSALFGRALVSSGFGVGGGIIANNSGTAKALALAATVHALDKGFTNIELRGGAIPEGWERWDDRHCGFTRALATDDDAELLAIPRKARAEVRKGVASGLRVTTGRTARDLAAHYACYSASVRNLGTPVFPKRLFQAMSDAFSGASDVLTVWRGDEPLSSVLSFYHAGTVMPFWGGGTFAARAVRANELMYYELMCHARRRGMTQFDFGRSKTGSGPYHFKKYWGFVPEPLTYGAWTAPGRKGRNIDPTDASYSRKIELWKKLPLPLANLIGPLIARGLA